MYVNIKMFDIDLFGVFNDYLFFSFIGCKDNFFSIRNDVNIE